MNKEVFLFGYSGHAYVVCDILLSSGFAPSGYLTKEPTKTNPYGLVYAGFEEDHDSLKKLIDKHYFVAIGNNAVRMNIVQNVISVINHPPCNAIAKSSEVSSRTKIGNGVMIGVGSIINAMATIGDGVICNTGSIVEHECVLEDFCHIAPGAILCGNVTIGQGSFIGARSIVKEGITIGRNVIIGAGTVVVRNIEDGRTVVGNPQRIIK